MAEFSIEIAGVAMATPLIAAAGTVGYGPELAEVADVTRFGALTTKSITVEERTGNPPWRVAELPGGMLNAIGLANVGLEVFVASVVPELGAVGTVVIGSIAGHSAEEYVEVAQAFDGIAALPLVELNVSCPNTDTGRQFGDDPDVLGALVGEVRAALRQTPLIVKLSPGSADVVSLARAAIAKGADAINIGNTMPGMVIDPETKRSRIGRASGGLSGPAIHPITSRLLHTLAEASLGVPLIATGGVARWQDAAAFIVLGATGVGIGTALMANPNAAKKISRGVERWVTRQGETLASLRGSVEV
jgi:dihydroorotate dehydrogenase (NAD+) catalytic subunit